MSHNELDKLKRTNSELTLKDVLLVILIMVVFIPLSPIILALIIASAVAVIALLGSALLVVMPFYIIGVILDNYKITMIAMIIMFLSYLGYCLISGHSIW